MVHTPYSILHTAPQAVTAAVDFFTDSNPKYCTKL